MSYKIVVDSCCELPEELKKDERFEIVPLGLEVGEWRIPDDENFNQAEFLWLNARSVPSHPALLRNDIEKVMNAMLRISMW